MIRGTWLPKSIQVGVGQVSKAIGVSSRGLGMENLELVGKPNMTIRGEGVSLSLPCHWEDGDTGG